MGKTLADALNAQPGPDSLAYWLAPFQGYWDRQGKLANEGLAWANKGFEKTRGGDPLGLLDELGGAFSYMASPVAAFVPTRDEIAASQLPEWAKPVMSGVSQGALVALPGPDLGPAASAAGRTARGVGEQAQMYADDFAQRFGVDVPAGAEVYGSGPVLRKPLGKGLGDMIGDATDAERAALAGRLKAETTQTGGQAVTTSRDQALRNLVEEQIGAPVRQYTPEEIAKLKARLAAEKTAEDEAIASSRRYIPPIEDFIPPSRKPKNDGASAAATAARVADEPQALRNLTEAPAWNPSALKDKYAAMSRDDLLAEAVKRGGVANPDKLSAPKLRQALFDMDVSNEQSRNLGKMVDRSLKNDPTSWQ